MARAFAVSKQPGLQGQRVRPSRGPDLEVVERDGGGPGLRGRGLSGWSRPFPHSGRHTNITHAPCPSSLCLCTPRGQTLMSCTAASIGVFQAGLSSLRVRRGHRGRALLSPRGRPRSGLTRRLPRSATAFGRAPRRSSPRLRVAQSDWRKPRLGLSWRRRSGSGPRM